MLNRIVLMVVSLVLFASVAMPALAQSNTVAACNWPSCGGGIDTTADIAGTVCATGEILEDQGTEWACIATPAGGGGGGEINTHSSDGGGLALTAATPKVGVDLRTVSLDAADFSVTTNLVTVDDDGHAHTTTSISGLVDADVSDTLTASSFVGFGSTSSVVDLNTTEVLGTLPFSKGGTGVTTFTQGSVMLGNGSTGFAITGVLTEGQLLIGDGVTFPAQVAMSGDGTLASSGALTIDSTLRTHSACVYIEDPVSDEDLNSVWRAPIALTITEIWCETDAGTAGLELTNDDGTPTGVNGSDISCAVSAGTSDSTFAGDALLAQDHKIDVNVGTVATATRLSVCWRYTVD